MFELIVLSLLAYLCSGIRLSMGRQIDGIYLYVISHTYYWHSDHWRKTTKCFRIIPLDGGQPPY